MYVVAFQLHRTPLIVAAEKGIAPLLELLIKYNASLDLRTEFVNDYSCDSTPLHCDMYYGDFIDWGVT